MRAAKALLAALLIYSLSMLGSIHALAWGEEGHSIVAEIAERHLSPAAYKKVHEILGERVSLASIASWADDVRGDRPESYNWHFVDPTQQRHLR